MICRTWKLVFDTAWPGGMREAVRRPARDGVPDPSGPPGSSGTLLQAFLDKVLELEVLRLATPPKPSQATCTFRRDDLLAGLLATLLRLLAEKMAFQEALKK